MRYLFGFMCVCTLVGTLPLSANAQDEAATSEPTLEEPAPPSEPALKLEVDSTVLEVTPTALPTIEELELRKTELRRRRRAIGISVSVIVVAVGVAVSFRNWEL